MRRVQTANASKGMKPAKAIYNQDIQIDDFASAQIRSEAMKFVENIMKSYFRDCSFNMNQVTAIVILIMDELLSSGNILSNLSQIKSVDDYTFEHSVNVCILSLLAGIGLGYGMSQLKDLATGALLHDIGKLKVPAEILKKPQKLTPEEFEEIKKHTEYGYEILKNNKNISKVSAFIAYGHHERFDGTGYPLQLKGDNIHQYARIVAVADVYDALTSDRVYRKKVRAHEVVEYILSLSVNQFDRDAVKSFISYIALYPVGTGVVLNTKACGLVVKANRNLPTRPIVRIIFDEHNMMVAAKKEVDLSVVSNLFISDICEI